MICLVFTYLVSYPSFARQKLEAVNVVARKTPLKDCSIRKNKVVAKVWTRRFDGKSWIQSASDFTERQKDLYTNNVLFEILHCRHKFSYSSILNSAPNVWFSQSLSHYLQRAEVLLYIKLQRILLLVNQIPKIQYLLKDNAKDVHMHPMVNHLWMIVGLHMYFVHCTIHTHL